MTFLTVSQRQQLLVEWNATHAEYPEQACIHHLFESQVEQTPDAVAVVYESEQLTYQALNQRANQLAHYLQGLGVRPEERVGICLERSLALAVGVLGILKAGGAYVPLDPTYPQERLAFMLEDAQPSVLVTQARLLGTLPEPGAHVICLDSDWEPISQESDQNPSNGAMAENLAYMLYTSGSTGRPKGVLVPHRAVVNHGIAVAKRYHFQVHDRILQFASISFDVAAEELYPPWFSGATVVLRSEQLSPSLTEFSQFIERQQLTVLDLPASYWHLWVAEISRSQAPLPLSLRLVIVGGETALHAPLMAWKKLTGNHVQWRNTYGPAEATIAATIYEPADGEEESEAHSVPIGRPIANVQIYLLDKELQPVPVGVPGEISIGGVGLARGYFRHPELTAERFIPHPFSTEPGARLYKTGDMARYLPDGNIEFLGRVDHQVKIRGYRVELGEIEAALCQHPLVRESVVLTWEKIPGEQQLVAYVLPDQEKPPTSHELRTYLKTKLPGYMVPSTFAFMDAWPLTPNDKIDRQALPLPEPARPDLDTAYVAPRTPVEEVLANIWAEMLHLERVGIYDSFFDLGGHSLAAARVVSRVREVFQVEFPLRSLFEASTIAALARMIEQHHDKIRDEPIPVIRAVPRTGRLPLSFPQEQVWFIQHLDPTSVAYTAPATLRLVGHLDIQALEQSISELVRRHEILRTTFPGMDGQPVQCIHPTSPVRLPVIDLQLLPNAEGEREGERLTHEELRTPFDVTQLPLIRWTLLRLHAQEHILIIVEHHLIHDGWSTNVLLGELFTLYQAFSEGRASPLPEPALQFADFAVWQREWMQGERMEAQLAYWKEKLAGDIPSLELPFDHPRPPLQRFRGASLRVQVPGPLCQSLKALSRQEGVTLYMTMAAAFLTLLYRYTGQHDLCIGTGVANRRWREAESLIGMIINTIVLRTDLSSDPSFQELLKRVREVTLEASAYADCPFDKLVEALQPVRNLSRNPLFQVMFGLHDAPMPDLAAPGLQVSLLEAPANGSAKFDISLIVIPRAEGAVGWNPEEDRDGMTLLWEYSTDLFDAATMNQMAEHFLSLLEGIVTNPTQHLSDVPLLTEAEWQQLLAWNTTNSDYPRNQCVHHLFTAQAEQRPEAVAVSFGKEQLTYRQLNQRANQLGHYLQALGVGPEVRVALCVERSADMVLGMLGILKAGGVYVPLDPTQPEERLAFMLEDAQASVLLTQGHLQPQMPPYQGKLISLDTEWPLIAQASEDNPVERATAGNLCYVMYTSGSTGRPKGIGIPHRAVNRLVLNTNYIQCSSSDRVAQASNASFDAATFEIWGALLHGAHLIGMTRDVLLSPQDFARQIREDQIDVLFLTTALFNQLAQEVPWAFASVRDLLIGGEALDPRWVRAVLTQGPPRRLLNVYGPTETTSFAAWHLVQHVPQQAMTIPIGRPIANTQLFLLDPHLQPVPTGVRGELYIGGDGLARGYLNMPTLTAERFIPHPFSAAPGARLYKTGDMARYLPDGTIEFLGRIDHQIKLRGFRIELGEIEAALKHYPGIQEALVVAREESTGEKWLAAYVVSAQQPGPAVPELRSFLQAKLPDYMIPAAFIILSSLPLTPSGKIDRKRLPIPERDVLAVKGARQTPRTPTEAVLASIWAEILGLAHVGVHDHFFEIGGHSLLAIRVLSRIRTVFQVELPLRSLFDAPTISDLALVIAQRQAETADNEAVEQMLAELEHLSEQEVQTLLISEQQKREG